MILEKKKNPTYPRSASYTECYFLELKDGACVFHPSTHPPLALSRNRYVKF